MNLFRQTSGQSVYIMKHLGISRNLNLLPALLSEKQGFKSR